jgi:hypothetical protein
MAQRHRRVTAPIARTLRSAPTRRLIMEHGKAQPERSCALPYIAAVWAVGLARPLARLGGRR